MNEPAFPFRREAERGGGIDEQGRRFETYSPSAQYAGMTLRDYFAAQAMNMVFVVHQEAERDVTNEEAARVAYAMADAMIAERSKP